MTKLIPETLRLLVQNAAAKNDMRYYLLGVHVEPAASPEEFTRLVATDGHRLSVIATRPVDDAKGEHKAYEHPKERSETSFVMCRQAIMDAFPASRLAKGLEELGEPDGLEVMLGERRIKLIDGRYPDWHQIMPNHDKRVSDMFEYLAKQDALDEDERDVRPDFDMDNIGRAALNADYIMQAGRFHKALASMAGGQNPAMLHVCDATRSVQFKQSGTISVGDEHTTVETVQFYAETLIMPQKA